MLLGIKLTHYGILYENQIGLSILDLKKQLATDQDIGALDGALRPLTALIGKNSTGKSALFGALSYIADCVKHGVPFASTLKRRGGFARLTTAGRQHEMGFDLLMQYKDNSCLRYKLELVSDKFHRPQVKRELVSKIFFDQTTKKVQEQSLLNFLDGHGEVWENGNKISRHLTDLKFPALSFFGVITAYPELCFLNHEIRHWYMCKPSGKEATSILAESGGHLHLNENCTNIANVLDYYRKEYKELYEDLLDRISALVPEGNGLDQAFQKGKLTSGTLRIFTFMLLLADPKPRPLICLEEPDSGLYHDIVEKLVYELRDYTLARPDCQIIFSTHDPYLLEFMNPEEVWIFERRAPLADITKEQKDQALIVTSCAGEEPLVRAMYEQGIGLGSMWYSGHFDKN